MLNEYYKFIANHIKESFVQDQTLKSGDKFFIHLDQPEDVLQLSQAFKDLDGIIIFEESILGDQVDENHSTYKATAFVTNNNKTVIVANTAEDISDAFLARLRNKVALQSGDYKDSVFIGILSEELETVISGSINLKKVGLPLNMLVIKKELEKLLKTPDINMVHKHVFLDTIDRIVEEYHEMNSDFIEFKSLYEIIKTKTIEKEQYAEFNMFYDPDLETFSKKEAAKRIEDNKDLFQLVDSEKKYGTDNQGLSKYFTPTLITELVKDDWTELNYSTLAADVTKFNELQQSSKVEYLEMSMEVIPKSEYWDRSLKETSAAKRTRHIIIFNAEKTKEISLQIPLKLKGKVKQLNESSFKYTNNNNLSINTNIKHKNIDVELTIDDANALSSIELKYAHKFKDQVAKSANTEVTFKILILPVESCLFESQKTKYICEPKKNRLVLTQDSESIKIGQLSNPLEKEVTITEENFLVNIDESEVNRFTIEPNLFNEDGELSLTLNINKSRVNLGIKAETTYSLPIKAINITKNLREKKMNFNWIQESNRLIQGNREYYAEDSYVNYLKWETQWQQKAYQHASADGEQLREIVIKVDDRLRESYGYFLQYFENQKTIASLTRVEPEFEKRAYEYLKVYQTLISEFEEDQAPLEKGVDLFKFGTIVANEKVYLTPYHPLMVAYKLEYYRVLESEEIDEGTLKRLKTEALLPFIYNKDNEVYKPESQEVLQEWLVYRPEEAITVTDANQFLEQVVNDKLQQFETHFKYLFLPQSKAPLQLNVINITNDLEVVKGIIQWLLKKTTTKSALKKLKPIEVTLYSEYNDHSSFDQLANLKTVEEFEHIFNIKLKKQQEFETEDLLKLIQNNITFYKSSLKLHEELKYSHITFYKMNSKKDYSVQNINDMETGFAINGLYNSVPSMKYKSMYKSGFGTKGYNIENTEQLLVTAELINELAANIKDEGRSGYRKKQSIVSNTNSADNAELKLLFEKSNWVTFIDPGVGLEFFKKIDSELMVIHYSDQYSSSSRYDAITVTNRTKQYETVIEDYLKDKDVLCDNKQLSDAITTFNTINGEWLLRVIGSRDNYSREKLSLASAIKYALAYFAHEKIVWVPISLEEILRVVGVYHLSKKDGIFTAKNLGVTGEKSDDLLLMGLSKTKSGLKMYMYPIEVKIGFNQTDVIKKAENQAKATAQLFKNVLVNNKYPIFKTKFYKNFFVQLYIANAQKMQNSKLWQNQDFGIEDSVKSDLLKGNIEFSVDHTKYIGEGAIISFKTDANKRSAKLGIETNLLYLDLTMNDGYKGITQSFEELKLFIHENSSDFSQKELLNNNFDVEKNGFSQKNISNSIEVQEVEIQEEVVEVEVEEVEEQEEEVVEVVEVEEQVEVELEEEVEVVKESVGSNPIKYTDISNVRIEIGEMEEQNRKIFWEYGKYGANAIANRHLLISGASGQGKTYLMQCLILELSKQGISNIVIDYTDSFLHNQLDPVFLDSMDGRLTQRIVYKDKLPVNPFKRYKIDLGFGDGIAVDEDDVDIAERFKSIFASEYRDLGIQQQNLLYELTIEGLKRYGDKMSLTHLKELLIEEDTPTAKKTLSQIVPLIDRNPFITDEAIDWTDHIEKRGEVLIIQLKGYTRNVQLLITEFILWDLWHYSTLNGNQKQPMPVIMDEAQNLDHTEGSPSAYILTEGRKFGWSGWYATQALSTLNSDEITRLQNAATKLYFKPPSTEVATLTKYIGVDRDQKDKWAEKLQNLAKGQCVFSGSTLLEDGELSNPINTIVNITSLETRRDNYKANK